MPIEKKGRLVLSCVTISASLDSSRLHLGLFRLSFSTLGPCSDYNQQLTTLINSTLAFFFLYFQKGSHGVQIDLTLALQSRITLNSQTTYLYPPSNRTRRSTITPSSPFSSCMYNLVPFYKVWHTHEFIFIQISFTQKFHISLNIYQASTIQQTLQVEEHTGNKRNTTGEE